MQDINQVVLIGRLTQDLGSNERDFGYIGTNHTAKANISIAVNSSKKQADGTWFDEASFFTVTIFGKTAENLKPYLKRGTQVALVGHLKQDRWEKDGQKRSAISIIADEVQLLGGKKEGGSTQSSASQPSQQASFDPAEGFSEDIPF